MRRQGHARMRIGIISDTHDNAHAVTQAVRALRDADAAFVLHAGDVTRPGTLAAFGEWPGAVVFGNNDLDEARLREEAARIGWHAGKWWTGTLDGVRIALAHGHERRVLTRLARPETVDVLVRGHSHRVQDEIVDGVRVVNPGALFRARRYTLAVLDTRDATLEVITLDKKG